MLQYLVILLDDMSVSFCNYQNTKISSRLIPIDVLHRGIIFAMKHNLNIQFVYPETDLPSEYQEEIASIDHTRIAPRILEGQDEKVIVINDLHGKKLSDFPREGSVVLRTKIGKLSTNIEFIGDILAQVERLNIILMDLELFSENDFAVYKDFLAKMSEIIFRLYEAGAMPQLNLLTDRLFLEKMNNCGAGDTTLTLAPNGKFYLCPAFYISDENQCVGNLEEGVSIKNQQLYTLSYAPICRTCDAYQCRRCIWQNVNTTSDCNTPSHEQCVVSHLERNASRELLNRLINAGIISEQHKVIPPIDYLDPFNNYDKWK